MISTMTTPVATGRPGWQPGHVPRLSYRNPLPAGEVLPQRIGTDADEPRRKPNGPGLSIREIREALPREALTNPTPSQIPTPVPAQKTKKSFLGSLFSKEPSIAALDQVAQQIIAQHGSVSPKSVPLVSSKKMPDHVPKVNSKWDGVPEHVKMREKQEKERNKAGHRTSAGPMTSRSRSTDFPEDESVIRRRNSNAASTTESWDSRSTGSRPVFHDDVSMRPGSIYSTSSGGSVHPAQHLAPSITKSYPSSATTKSPESSSYYVCDVTDQSSSSTRPPVSQSSLAQSAGYTSQGRPDRLPRMTVPSTDTVPEYTSSSATTPLERSPKTPSPLPDEDKSLDYFVKTETMLPAPVTTKKIGKQAMLGGAGDIKATSRTKSISRPGLGLKTNVAIAPWESQDLPSKTVTSPQSPTSTSSRGKTRLFGREKK